MRGWRWRRRRAEIAADALECRVAIGRHRGNFGPARVGGEGGLLDLGGTYGLHPALAGFHAMYRANEGLVLHAVAGPYRTRSHFEAQDLLEGGGGEQRMESGWLNRALQAMPQPAGRASRLGLAVGLDVPLLMRGPVAVGAYAPPFATQPAPELFERLAALYAADRDLARPFAEGMRARGFTTGTVGDAAPTARGGDGNRGGAGGAFAQLAEAAARLLAAADGPRVAALELGGWDTHSNQLQRLEPVLKQLDAGLAGLKTGLGPAWRTTAVLVMTEFGRTVRVNGSGGTDHGTGGVAFLAGGAVAGGRVAADWPGLAEGRLFQGRDLAPTRDLRAVAKGLLASHLKLAPRAVNAAFPGAESVPAEARLVRG